jgi:exopolyphosphatase/guanosine-5'-triphosphate,3'-diphosphate pyrophosphatase
VDASLSPSQESRTPGRIPGRAPIAIIDIGSNSVRLVIYEGPARSPTPLYNEKLFCGLGRDIASTGRLSEEAIERALAALARYKVLCTTAGVRTIRVLATAAARMAENGPAFIEAAREACGSPVELLTGEREALLSAAGVISGLYEPDGVVGDLGGGSLEVVDVKGGRAGPGITLPLGGLVLRDMASGSPKAAAKIARTELERAPQLQALAGRTFYAVGGTWRALARMQMVERGYPLRVMHGYEFELKRGGFQRIVERTTPAAMKVIGSVSEARRPLPWTWRRALLLDRRLHAQLWPAGNGVRAPVAPCRVPALGHGMACASGLPGGPEPGDDRPCGAAGRRPFRASLPGARRVLSP